MKLLVQMHWIVRKMNGKTQNNKHREYAGRFRDFGISMPDAGRERIEFTGKVQHSGRTTTTCGDKIKRYGGSLLSLNILTGTAMTESKMV
jgi:hypothetical protein